MILKIFRRHFLSVTFFPKNNDSLMKNIGNLLEARNRFLKSKQNNLLFLLSKIYLDE